jgi:hypothetical protein
MVCGNNEQGGYRKNTGAGTSINGNDKRVYQNVEQIRADVYVGKNVRRNTDEDS